MPFRVETAGCTHTGKVRTHNEDFWSQLPDLGLYVLADGMGGHQAGEVASREAVQGLCRLFHQAYSSQDSSWDPYEASEILRSLIQEVNSTVYRRGCEDLSMRGMGTTLCCTYLCQDRVIFAHVGDSRIYRFRDGQLERMTIDHSLMSELIEQGILLEEDREDFLYKNIITKAVGLEPTVEPVVDVEEVRPGDLFLMCTDGLTDMLDDLQIQEVMVREMADDDDLDHVAASLITRANEEGGQDNVTVVLVQICNSNDG